MAAAEDSTAVEEGTTAVAAVEEVTTAAVVAADITVEVVDTTTVEEVTTAAVDTITAVEATTADTTVGMAVTMAVAAAIGDTPVSESGLDTGLVGASALASAGEDIGRPIRMGTGMAARGVRLTIRTITLTPITTLRRLTYPANRTFLISRTLPTRAGTIRMITLRQRNRVLPCALVLRIRVL